MNKRLILPLCILIGVFAQAQSSFQNGFEFSHQSQYFNPAVEPVANWQFSIPLSIYFRGGATHMKMRDLFLEGSDFGQNVDVLVNRLDGKERIYIQSMIEAFYMGFRVKNMYFSAGAYGSIDVNLYGLSAPLKLPINGNGAYIEEPLDLSPFQAQVLNKITYHVGMSMDAPFLEGLRLGARLKVVEGMQHVSVERNTTTLQTDSNTYYININSDFLAQTTGLEELVGPFAFKNIGFGIDLGGTYRFKDRWVFQAAITDLGFIQWKEGTKLYENDNASFTYEGQVYDYNEGNGFDFQEVLDSLEAALLPNSRTEAYTSGMFSRVNLGATYQVTPKFTADAFLRGRLIPDHFQPGIQLGATYALLKRLRVRATYMAAPGTLANYTAGFAWNLGPMQLSLIAENPHVVWDMASASNAGVYFGLTFGGFKVKENGPRGLEPKKKAPTENKAPKEKKGGLFKKKQSAG